MLIFKYLNGAGFSIGLTFEQFCYILLKFFTHLHLGPAFSPTFR